MGASRLLIVDDESALLGLLRRYLEKLGYVVETAGGSQEALARFEANPSAFDLVITDLTLAGLTGEELIARMRKHNTKLRGIISSGYPHEPQISGVSFLQKPFLPDMLAEAVEKALRKRPKAP